MSKKLLPNQTSPTEVHYHVYSGNIQDLEGQLLTLIDATFSDPEQRKAFKDITRQTIWKWIIPQQEGFPSIGSKSTLDL